MWAGQHQNACWNEWHIVGLVDPREGGQQHASPSVSQWVTASCYRQQLWADKSSRSSGAAPP